MIASQAEFKVTSEDLRAKIPTAAAGKQGASLRLGTGNGHLHAWEVGEAGCFLNLGVMNRQGCWAAQVGSLGKAASLRSLEG